MAMNLDSSGGSGALYPSVRRTEDAPPAPTTVGNDEVLPPSVDLEPSPIKWELMAALATIGYGLYTGERLALLVGVVGALAFYNPSGPQSPPPSSGEPPGFGVGYVTPRNPYRFSFSTGITVL
jgi:hypothetical protein